MLATERQIAVPASVTNVTSRTLVTVRYWLEWLTVGLILTRRKRVPTGPSWSRLMKLQLTKIKW
jgi:hypothetical protein